VAKNQTRAPGPTTTIGESLGDVDFVPTAEGDEPEPSAAAQMGRESVEISEGVGADVSLMDAFGAEETDPVELARKIEEIRATRKPFGGQGLKLALPKRVGYYRYWFSDTAGRIELALASGWSHIKNRRDGKPIKRTVGSGRDGNALIGFAMELPEVIWLEDVAARNKIAEQAIESIRKSPFRAAAGSSKPADRGKFYSADETAGPLQISKG
jgi:hypothetical protein